MQASSGEVRRAGDVVSLASLPGARFISTSDLDEFQATLSTAVEPRVFLPVGKAKGQHCRVTRVALPRSQIFGVQLHSVRAICEEMQDYQAIMPIAGSLVARSDAIAQPFGRGELLLICPGQSLDITWSDESQAIALHIPRHDLDVYMRNSDAFSLASTANKMHMLSANRGIGLTLCGTLAQLCREADDTGNALDGAIAEVEDSLLFTFARMVESQLVADVRYSLNMAPRHLSRAVEFIMANLDRAIRIEDLVAKAYVSPRTLQYAFKKQFGMGPIAFIRLVRMHRARMDLQSATPGKTTVTEIAYKRGFKHSGEFARQYLAMFNEKPSQTLQRS